MEKNLISITWDLLFQIINTIVLFVILGKILFKPVMKIIDEREKDIQESLALGERSKKEGLAFKKEYEEKINSAKSEGQEIIKQATLRADQKSDEIISNAKLEASRIKEKTAKDVEQERIKAMHEVKNDISNIALLAASKVIEKDIDKSKHEQLINNFIKEVGEAK